MNSPADDLALALRVAHPGQSFEEARLGVDRHQLGTRRRHEIPLHLFAFAGPQQTMVDEHTREAVTDGTLNQRRGHRGVHSPDSPQMAWASPI